MPPPRSLEPKNRREFQLSDKGVERLKRLCKLWDCNNSEAIEHLLELDERDQEIAEQRKNNPPRITARSRPG